MWLLGECLRIRVFISRKSSLEDASKICSNPAENVSRRDVAAAPSPPLIFSLPLSLPLFFATHETGGGGKDDYVAPSMLFVSTRKPINPSKPISPEAKKFRPPT